MNDDTTNRDAPASSGAAQGSADDLRVIVDGDEMYIWWEDLVILGSGKTLDEARLSVVETVAAIMKQLPHLSPPNKKVSDPRQ